MENPIKENLNELVKTCYNSFSEYMFNGNEIANKKQKNIFYLIQREIYLANITSTLITDSVDFSDISKYDVNYLAGLFDGEGHIGINKSSKTTIYGTKSVSYNHRIQLTSTDKEVIEPLISLGGKITIVEGGRWNKNASKSYSWNVEGKRALEILSWIYPYMKINRKKLCVKLVLMNGFLKKKAGGNVIDLTRIPKQDSIHKCLKNLNSKALPTFKDDEHLVELTYNLLSNIVKKEKNFMTHLSLDNRPMAEVELADALIRICDYAGRFGYDLGGAVSEKLEYNKNRADHKIENRLKDKGKKF